MAVPLRHQLRPGSLSSHPGTQPPTSFQTQASSDWKSTTSSKTNSQSTGEPRGKPGEHRGPLGQIHLNVSAPRLCDVQVSTSVSQGNEETTTSQAVERIKPTDLQSALTGAPYWVNVPFCLIGTEPATLGRPPRWERGERVSLLQICCKTPSRPSRLLIWRIIFFQKNNKQEISNI